MSSYANGKVVVLENGSSVSVSGPVDLGNLNGAATEAKQDAQIASLTQIDNNTAFLPFAATESTLSETNNKLDSISANQTSEISYLNSIDTSLDNIESDIDAVRVSSAAINTKLTSQATAARQDDILSAIQGLNAKTITANITEQVLPVIQKRIALNTYTLSVFRNFGSDNTLNIKNVLGNIFSVSFTNKNTSNTHYFQLWDTIGLAGTGTLIEEFMVPPNSQLILGADYFDINGTYFADGLAFGFSSTSLSFTGATASEQNTIIKYL